MKSYVYKITCLINNKIYIGKTNDIEQRWRCHRSQVGFNKNPLYKAMYKYGIDNFKFEIIEEFTFEEDALKKEIYFIALYKTNIHKYGNDFGYNLTDGGEGTSGHKVSEEYKQKLSKDRSGSGNQMYNKTHSLKSREKISNNGKNRYNPKSQESIQKMIDTKRKNKENGIKNLYLSDEIRQSIIEEHSKCELTIKQIAEKFKIRFSQVKGTVNSNKRTKEFKFFTENEKQDIINLYNNKISAKDIAAKYNCKWHHISRLLKNLGVRRQKVIIIDNKIKEDIIKYFIDYNYSYEQISRKFNIKIGTITSKLNRIVTKIIKSDNLPHPGIIRNRNIKIIEKYKLNKYSHKELSKMFDVSVDVIKNTVSRHKND